MQTTYKLTPEGCSKLRASWKKRYVQYSKATKCWRVLIEKASCEDPIFHHFWTGWKGSRDPKDRGRRTEEIILKKIVRKDEIQQALKTKAGLEEEDDINALTPVHPMARTALRAHQHRLAKFDATVIADMLWQGAEKFSGQPNNSRMLVEVPDIRAKLLEGGFGNNSDMDYNTFMDFCEEIREYANNFYTINKLESIFIRLMSNLGEDLLYRLNIVGPEFDLFLFLVLQNRMEMAMEMFKQVAFPVRSCLTAVNSLPCSTIFLALNLICFF